MPYFDNNATTSLSSAAEEAWLKASRENWQNPSSPYRSAQRARALLEARREILAKALGCSPSSIAFNSGATEGNNAVFQSFARANPDKGRVLISSVEHPSVIETAHFYFPGRVDFLPLENSGVVDADALDALLERPETVLVSVMAANNETGVLMPWRIIREACRRRGIPFHCDAAQWVGKMPLNDLGLCDFVTSSAHKFGGPKGTGFIKVSERFADFSSMIGGGQENRRRGGTENYPALAAMLTAFEAANDGLEEKLAEGTRLRDEFEKSVTAMVPGTVVTGAEADRLWNTVSLIMPAHENTRWVASLDRRGFIVSTGSACATGKSGPSHVLSAMGVPPDQVRRSVRVSGFLNTSAEAWRALARVFGEAWEELNSPRKGAGNTFVVSI